MKHDYVKLVHGPNLRTDTYPTAPLEKFRGLEPLQYDRVRFLDPDLIPLCNLDIKNLKTVFKEKSKALRANEGDRLWLPDVTL